jgi:L-seryl-tRNA(Ser) seleniumtransferase
VHRLLDEPRVARFVVLFGSAAVKAQAGTLLDELRRADALPDTEAIVADLCARLAREERAGLVPVLNGSGIILHTNLGRAPLAASALAAMNAIAGGYSNLEYDLESGARGSRYARLSTLLRAVSGAEDAIVVNNCAAAVLLILDTYARGREVIVSRNQLIEIGGGFRLPDVLARSGATLVEVGTTNKVYLRDVERALTAQTALFLRSHPSNFRIAGFVADIAPAELAALGKRTGVPVVEDLGTGAIVDLEDYGLPHERTVREAIADGIDLVAFSGDKLLGGPQAGIIVGRAAPIARLRANPLLRALRVDKATLAALGATLQLSLTAEGRSRIPFYAMIGASLADLRARALALAGRLGASGLDARVDAAIGYVGGGSLPLAEVPSIAVSVHPRSGDANALAARYRAATPPLIARSEGDRVSVDLRTIPPERDAELAQLLSIA